MGVNNLILEAKKKFLRSNGLYSYVILTPNNEWVASGFNEDEETFKTFIEDIMKDFKDVVIYEITGSSIKVNR